MKDADFSENVKLNKESSNKIYRDRVFSRNKIYEAKLLAFNESLRIS